MDTNAFMHLSMQITVKVALILQIYPLKLIIIKKMQKVVNYKLLISSLILNQHYMEIYLLLTSLKQNQKKLNISVHLKENKMQYQPLRMQHASYHIINTLQNVKCQKNGDITQQLNGYKTNEILLQYILTLDQSLTILCCRILKTTLMGCIQ